jgi:polyisoprenyl-phosphate glycosyltransferase
MTNGHDVVLSIVTPAYNERENLPLLYERLMSATAGNGVEWEWIVVDDHSHDDTFEVVRQLAARDGRVRCVRLSRNSGSHVAIACGLQQARGEAAALLAADMQDPPELLQDMLVRWRGGAQVVWAVRRTRPGDRAHRGFAAVYYWIMRHLVGMSETPATGADSFLIDRLVIDAFCQAHEKNTNVFALITWFGFRQDHIAYDKQPRARGRSRWTLAKKLTLVADSVTSFSDFPIRWTLGLGTVLLVAAVAIGLTGLALLPAPRAVLLLFVSLIIGLAGVQLCALAVVGQYVWRALDAARNRPLYVIESDTRQLART